MATKTKTMLRQALLFLLLLHLATPTSPSLILQDSIVQQVNNANPSAGWTAHANPYFANHTVAQFKHMLGAKRTPLNALHEFPLATHQNQNYIKSLPKEFDARTAWPHCTTIGRILG